MKQPWLVAILFLLILSTLSAAQDGDDEDESEIEDEDEDDSEFEDDEEDDDDRRSETSRSSKSSEAGDKSSQSSATTERQATGGECQAERDAEIQEATANRDEGLADAAADRDEELNDPDSSQEDKDEARAEYDEEAREIEAEFNEELEDIESDYRECLDDEEFDDDEDGFEDRRTKVRFDRSSPGFAIPGSTSMQHQFIELIEFIDQDANGIYEPSEQVLQRHNLTRSPDEITGNHTKRVTYNLEPGALHLDVRSSGNSTKFDVVVEDYEFSREDSMIAISSAIRVESGVKFSEVNGDPAILAAGAGDLPYLSWVENVTVDGRNETVGWSVLASLTAEGGSALVYWAYPQGDMIVHDPVLGITSVAIEKILQPKIFAIAGAASVIFLALGAMRARR